MFASLTLRKDSRLLAVGVEARAAGIAELGSSLCESLVHKRVSLHSRSLEGVVDGDRRSVDLLLLVPFLLRCLLKVLASESHEVHRIRVISLGCGVQIVSGLTSETGQTVFSGKVVLGVDGIRQVSFLKTQQQLFLV